ncbi:penicillin-binding transpeptidase domain-containing protein [Thalassotalea atypica]|uniref:penicillin-binding transpeptidase domain-containing protein n=1 Tax=Thalassotalea atypica TaxID=2054316 RepID=UPI0025735E21|nr:penicillin-binding transpeptidase domain-containing protein [Thalassotalea atypica]
MAFYNSSTLYLLALLFSMLTITVSARQPNMYCDDNNNHCTFVLLNGKTNKLIISNKQRAKTRLPPFSTFKIPNSLIALETGIIDTVDEPIVYNADVYPAQNWWPQSWLKTEHTLEQAFKNSVLPIYRTIATKIGEKEMQIKLNAFNYGNRDISSGLDSFWLDKSIAISAIEQVQFLKKLHKREFELKDESYQKLEQIMEAERSQTYQLYAKTGGGQIAASKALGWYVGYTIYNHVPFYFAFNMNDKTFNELKTKRITIAKQSLVQYGALPESALH